MTEKPKFKEILKNFSLLVLTFLVIFILLEAGLRIFWPQNTEFIMFDKELGHKLIPNYADWSVYPFTLQEPETRTFVKINSQGIRDYEYSYKKNPNIYRIIGIGDSMMYGSGVYMNETFLKILEKKLNNNNNNKFEVINFGVMGYSTDNYLIYLKKVTEIYNPDMVLVSFLIGNDFTLNGLLEFKEGSIIPKELPLPPLSLRLRRFLARNSHAYNFFIRLFNSNDYTRKVLKGIGLFQRDIPFLGIKSENDYLNKLAEVELIFQEIKEYTKKKDIELVVVILPIKEQVSEEEFTRYFSSHCSKLAIPLTKPQKDLIHFLEKEEIKVLEPLDILKIKAKQEPLFFSIDGHFTRYGNELMAELIYEKLINTGLFFQSE